MTIGSITSSATLIKSLKPRVTHTASLVLIGQHCLKINLHIATSVAYPSKLVTLVISSFIDTDK